MARKAILLPYSVNQNEPSTPLKFIVTIPDNVKARDALLKELFFEHVSDNEDATITITTPDEGYGDIVVASDDEVFLFATYIEEER